MLVVTEILTMIFMQREAEPSVLRYSINWKHLQSCFFSLTKKSHTFLSVYLVSENPNVSTALEGHIEALSTLSRSSCTNLVPFSSVPNKCITIQAVDDLIICMDVHVSAVIMRVASNCVLIRVLFLSSSIL